MICTDTRRFYIETFGFVTVKICWLVGFIEIKSPRNLNLLYKTIENNINSINSILFKVYNNRDQYCLKIKQNFFKTKALLYFNSSISDDDIIRKLIYLILKIDVEKDLNIIADALLNGGKENYIYKILSESKSDDYYSNVFGGY